MINLQYNPVRPVVPAAPPASIRLIVCIFISLLYLCWNPSVEASAWVSSHTRTSDGYFGDFSWDTEDDETVICNATACSVAICYYVTGLRNICGNPSETSTRVFIPFNATVKDAHTAFINKNGTNGAWSIITSIAIEPSTCFGIMYWQGSNDYNLTGAVIPGAYCGKPPPPTTKCELLNDIEFDYGTLSSGEVPGSSKTENIDVQCSANANITLTLVGQKNITLGGGITSTISSNGKDLSTGVNVSVTHGSESVPVTSTLSSDAGTVAGTYSGSGIVVLGFQ